MSANGKFRTRLGGLYAHVGEGHGFAQRRRKYGASDHGSFALLLLAAGAPLE